MSDVRPTPPDRPRFKPEPTKVPGPGVSLQSLIEPERSLVGRTTSAVLVLVLVAMGFVAICGHAERMAQERDICLDRLHGTSHGR